MVLRSEGEVNEEDGREGEGNAKQEYLYGK